MTLPKGYRPGDKRQFWDDYTKKEKLEILGGIIFVGGIVSLTVYALLTDNMELLSSLIKFLIPI